MTQDSAHGPRCLAGMIIWDMAPPLLFILSSKSSSDGLRGPAMTSQACWLTDVSTHSLLGFVQVSFKYRDSEPREGGLGQLFHSTLFRSLHKLLFPKTNPYFNLNHSIGTHISPLEDNPHVAFHLSSRTASLSTEPFTWCQLGQPCMLATNSSGNYFSVIRVRDFL